MHGHYARKTEDGRFEYGLVKQHYRTLYSDISAQWRDGLLWLGEPTHCEYLKHGEAASFDEARALAEAAAAA